MSDYRFSNKPAVAFVLFSLCFGQTNFASVVLNAEPISKPAPDVTHLLQSPLDASDRGKQQSPWSIQCYQSAHNCIARAPGMALWLDHELGLRFSVAAGSNARISIQERNYTTDAPKILSSALTKNDIHRLSQPNSFIVVEEMGKVIFRNSTFGLDQIYASLLKANGGRDPIEWGPVSELKAEEQDAESAYLPRHSLSAAGATEFPQKLLPSNKPQSEFAIRAQGGNSFFSETGQAGN